MSTTDFEIERHCSINKKPGIAQLSSSHLVWTPDSAAHGSELTIPLTTIRSFQVTKQSTSKKALIRLTLSDRNDKPTLDFQKNFSDRDAFRDMLGRLQAPATAMNATHSSQTPTAAQNQSATPTPGQMLKPLTPEELARRRVLFQRKEVINLHRAVVDGGAMSDDAFWAAMRYRYKDNGEPRGRAGLAADDDAETANGTNTNVYAVNGENGAGCNSSGPNVAALLRQGVPSDAFVASGIGSLSDGGSNSGGGNSGSGGGNGGVGIDGNSATAPWTSDVPSAAQRHLVFMNRPSVARAYRELVGVQKMSEVQFWTYFAASSAGQRVVNGSSVTAARRRSKTDTARTAEADGIFAPFEAAERRLAASEIAERARRLARELDLGRRDEHRGEHVAQTHGGDSADSEVHAGGLVGRETSSGLRLMRLVNRHGGLVLDEGGVGTWKTEGVDRERPLDDLVLPEERTVARLGVEGVEGFATAATTAGGMGAQSGISGCVNVEACEGFGEIVGGWKPDVGRFRRPNVDGPQMLDELLTTMRP